MDHGPESKRPKIGPGPGAWENNMRLPPPPQRIESRIPFPHNTPFSQPSNPHSQQPNIHPLPPHYSQEHHDPHRPMPGPSHLYHNSHVPPPLSPYGNGPRENIIKRDPSDDPTTQHRPPSANNGPDHHVNSPYNEERGRPFPPKFEQPSVTPPYHPNHQSQNQMHYQPPQAQSPMTTTPTYESSIPNLYNPSPQPQRDQYQSAYSSAQSNNNVKRKAQRAAQACDSCRTLKAKCDEGRPSCSTCREKGAECRYRDPPPKQIDKSSVDIMDGISRLESLLGAHLKTITAKVADIEAKVERVEQSQGSLRRILNESSSNVPGMQHEYVTHAASGSRPSLTTNHSYGSTSGHTRIIEGIETAVSVEESEEEENAEPPPPGKALIPVNHTTGAARLLLVTPIKKMAEKAFTKKVKDEKYPMFQEDRRGLLRLFGRGEGKDTAQGYDKDPLIDHDTPGDRDSASDVSSPAGDQWGQIGGMTPPPTSIAPEYPVRPVIGTINADGMPDFDRLIVLDLVRSYKEHINILHPILIPSRLDALVESFLRSISDTTAKPRAVTALTTLNAGFVVGKNPESPGNKRKRSPAPDHYAHYDPSHTFAFLKPGHPNRSISTALVLVVLALGKICQEKNKIPELASERDRDTDAYHLYSPSSRNGHQSPIQGSPLIGSYSHPEVPSPQLGSQDVNGDRTHFRRRSASLEGAYMGLNSTRIKPRNIDVIPGLAYFALATDIIGNQLGGNSLQHVHVNILAGLYHGQLARVLESHAYIHQACRALQVLLRPKLDRFKKLAKSCPPVVAPVKDNPLIFAFWTCLQLESDIVAELPCPHSGILTLEEDMPSPNLEAASEEGIDPIVLRNYSAQLFMRKHLNQLHNMFYKPDNDSQFPSVFAGKEPNHFLTISAVEANLETMRDWDENDPPGTDILTARLRAKFYGAQVITYRNFVLKILEHSASKLQNPGERISHDFRSGIGGVPTSIVNVTRPEQIDPQALEYAKYAIRALIKSTTAFHGLGDGRLLVTNVWGTAHAQWGNMLTLQAVYMDPILRPLFDEIFTGEDLAHILLKTIRFLCWTAASSSALMTDIRILEHAGKYTGLLGDDYRRPVCEVAGSSFTSVGYS